jgi:fucose permease
MIVKPAEVRSKVRRTTGVFFFLSGLIITTWTSRIPEIQQKFALTNAELGYVLFAVNAGLIVALPFSSWIIARISSSRMMVLTAILYGGLLPFLALSNNVYLLIALLFCFGVARTWLSMSANTNTIEVQQLYDKPIIAKFHGIWSLACFVGVGIGAWMISKSIAPVIHFTGIAVIILVSALGFKRKPKAVRSEPGKRPFFVKPGKYLFILGLITFCSMSCESAMFDWSVNYFDKVVKADKTLVAAGYSAFIIMFTIGRLIGDQLVAKLGALQVLFFNGLLMTIGFTIAIAFPHVWTASAGFLLVGFGGSIVVPMVYSLAGQTTTMPPSYAIVSVTMIGYVGFLICPLMMGGISERWGMQSAFGLIAFYTACISIIALGLIKNWWMKPSVQHN